MQKLTPEQRQQRNDAMVQASRDGATHTQIAARFGLSLHHASLILRHRGIPAPEHGKGVKHNLDYRDFIKPYNEGATVRALADKAGVSYGAMHRGLSMAGVVFRSRGSQPSVRSSGRSRTRSRSGRA